MKEEVENLQERIIKSIVVMDDRGEIDFYNRDENQLAIMAALVVIMEELSRQKKQSSSASDRFENTSSGGYGYTFPK